jgi:hypothetical protein
MIMKQLVEQELAGKTEVLREACPSTTLPTANTTRLDLGSNPGRRGGGDGDSSQGDSPSIRSVLPNSAVQKRVHTQNVSLGQKTLEIQ